MRRTCTAQPGEIRESGDDITSSEAAPRKDTLCAMLGPVSPRKHFAPVSPGNRTPPFVVQAAKGLSLSPGASAVIASPSGKNGSSGDPRLDAVTDKYVDDDEDELAEPEADILVDVPAGFDRRISIAGSRASVRPGFATAAWDAVKNLQQLEKVREQEAGQGGALSAADEEAKRRLVESVTQALLRPLEGRTDEEYELLRSWVHTLDMKDERMVALRKNHIDSFINACTVKCLKPNTVLFRQDATGDDMYIVMTGSVGMFRRADADTSKAIADAQRMAKWQPSDEGAGEHVDWENVVTKYGPALAVCHAGHQFGELAAIYEQPRAASAVVVKEATVVVVHFRNLLALVRKGKENSTTAKLAFLHSVPQLASVDKSDLSRLQYRMKTVSLAAGSTVLKVGMPASTVVIVRKGYVAVRLHGYARHGTATGQTWEERLERDIGVYGSKTLLGELSSNRTNHFTVVTASECELLAIERDEFFRILGPQTIEACKAYHNERWGQWLDLLHRSARAVATVLSEAQSSAAGRGEKAAPSRASSMVPARGGSTSATASPPRPVLSGSSLPRSQRAGSVVPERAGSTSATASPAHPARIGPSLPLSRAQSLSPPHLSTGARALPTVASHGASAGSVSAGHGASMLAPPSTVARALGRPSSAEEARISAPGQSWRGVGVRFDAHAQAYVRTIEAVGGGDGGADARGGAPATGKEGHATRAGDAASHEWATTSVPTRPAHSSASVSSASREAGALPAAPLARPSSALLAPRLRPTSAARTAASAQHLHRLDWATSGSHPAARAVGSEASAGPPAIMPPHLTPATRTDEPMQRPPAAALDAMRPSTAALSSRHSTLPRRINLRHQMMRQQQAAAA